MQEEDSRTETFLEIFFKWIIGVGVIALLPFVLPIGAAIAIVYYIPKTIGGWIYELIKKL